MRFQGFLREDITDFLRVGVKLFASGDIGVPDVNAEVLRDVDIIFFENGRT